MNMVMIAIGLGLILLGALLMMLAAFSSRARVRGAGVILIGPFPIIFGDRTLKPALLLFAALIAFLLLVFVILSGL